MRASVARYTLLIKTWGAPGDADAGSPDSLSGYRMVEPEVVRIKEDTMDAQEILAQAKDTMTVKRVFGEPYEKNGLTLVPVAAVAGGAGAGSGGEAAGGNST